MIKPIYVNGIKVYPPEFVCPACGNEELSFKYLESNKSIQMRCSNCGKWHGNYKYDLRPQEQIKRDKTELWKRERKQNRIEAKI